MKVTSSKVLVELEKTLFSIRTHLAEAKRVLESNRAAAGDTEASVDGVYDLLAYELLDAAEKAFLHYYKDVRQYDVVLAACLLDAATAPLLAQDDETQARMRTAVHSLAAKSKEARRIVTRTMAADASARSSVAYQRDQHIDRTRARSSTGSGMRAYIASKVPRRDGDERAVDADVPSPVDFAAKLTELVEKELVKYLLLTMHPIDENHDPTPDPLQWWRDGQHTFPLLASVARLALGMPASQVSVEEKFSRAKHVRTALRNRLSDLKLQMLLFLKANGSKVGVFN
jgi:hypothetical protein